MRRPDFTVFAQKPIQANTGLITKLVVHLHKSAFRKPVDRIGFLVVELESLALLQMQLKPEQEYN